MNWNKYPDSVLDGCAIGIMKVLVVTILLVSIICSLSGCKHIEYVPIETTHTIEHHHTDSVREVDSIFKNKETIIMQLDSEAMAQYGIRLQAAERAWLVRTAELERQLQKMQHTKTDTFLKIDSIPIPYPVVKVETKTNYGGWWAFGGLLLFIAAVAALFIILRKKE